MLNRKLDWNFLLYFLLIKLIDWWNFVQNVTLCSYVACTTLGESKGIYHFVKGCCTQALALLDSNDLTQRSVESNWCRLSRLKYPKVSYLGKILFLFTIFSYLLYLEVRKVCLSCIYKSILLADYRDTVTRDHSISTYLVILWQPLSTLIKTIS